MRWLRFFNPDYVRQLEREVAAILGQRRAIKSLVDSIGRQAPAGSETELRGRTVLLQGRVHALETGIGVARVELERGRPAQAHSLLCALLDADPIDQREAS